MEKHHKQRPKFTCSKEKAISLRKVRKRESVFGVVELKMGAKYVYKERKQTAIEKNKARNVIITNEERYWERISLGRGMGGNFVGKIQISLDNNSITHVTKKV